MPQFDFPLIDPEVTTGTDLAGFLNSWVPAVESSHSGAVRPTYAAEGMLWLDKSGGAANWALKLYDGADDITIARIDSTANTIIGGAGVFTSVSTAGTITGPVLTSPAATDLLLNAPTGKLGRLAINNVTAFQWDAAKLFPAAHNTLDLGAVAAAFRTGYFGTSVVTPLMGTDSASALQFKTNGAVRWTIEAAGILDPNTDNAFDFGATTNRVRSGYFGTSVVTPLLDSGAVLLTIRKGGADLLTIGAAGTVLINSLQDGLQLTRTSAAGGTQYINLANSGGRVMFGIEASSSGPLLGGGTPFAGQLFTVGATPIELGMNNQITARFNGGGPGNNFLIFSAAGGDPSISVSGGSLAFSSPIKANGGIVPSFESAEQAWAAGTPISLAHGLGARPKNFSGVMRCLTAELGYSVGDEMIPTPEDFDTLNTFGMTVWVNATNIGAIIGAAVRVIHKTTGSLQTLTIANWRVVLRAWK